LALIAEKKNAKPPPAPPKPPNKTQNLDENVGLNEMVSIKKSATGLVEKRQSPNNKKERFSLSPIKLRVKQDSGMEKSETGLKQRQIFRKSLLVEEELAEVADTLGIGFHPSFFYF